jgi:peptidyl-prolyl cis-trans isomerase SurA
MSVRSYSRTAAASLLALVLFAPSGRAEVVDGIAIVVDEDIILMSDVVERAQQVMMQWEAVYQESIPLEQAMSVAAGELVDNLLIKQLAVKMHVSVSSKEVDAALENQLVSQDVDLDQFEALLEAQGLGIEEYKNEVVKTQLLRYKVLGLKIGGPKVTEAMVKDYYNEQVASVRAQAPYEIADILVAAPEDAGIIELAEYRKEAEEIARRAREPDADFAALAAVHSDGRTAETGGYVGEFEPGDLPASIENVVLKLDVGEISEPVRTSTGFHVIKLVSRHSAKVKSYEEARDAILNDLIEKEMMRQEEILLKELRRSTYIEILKQ